MDSNPQVSLDQLRRRVKAYVYAQPKDQAEAKTTLHTTLHRAEIDVANLGRTMGNNVEHNQRYREILLHVELAKGELRVRETLARR